MGGSLCGEEICAPINGKRLGRNGALSLFGWRAYQQTRTGTQLFLLYVNFLLSRPSLQRLIDERKLKGGKKNAFLSLGGGGRSEDQTEKKLSQMKCNIQEAGGCGGWDQVLTFSSADFLLAPFLCSSFGRGRRDGRRGRGQRREMGSSLVGEALEKGRWKVVFFSSPAPLCRLGRCSSSSWRPTRPTRSSCSRPPPRGRLAAAIGQDA